MCKVFTGNSDYLSLKIMHRFHLLLYIVVGTMAQRSNLKNNLTSACTGFRVSNNTNFNLMFGTLKDALLHPMIIYNMIILMIVRASTGLKESES